MAGRIAHDEARSEVFGDNVTIAGHRQSSAADPGGPDVLAAKLLPGRQGVVRIWPTTRLPTSRAGCDRVTSQMIPGDGGREPDDRQMIKSTSVPARSFLCTSGRRRADAASPGMTRDGTFLIENGEIVGRCRLP